MKDFESFWDHLLEKLNTPEKIKNWTTKKGYYGEDFTAQRTISNNIQCITLRGSSNSAGKKDFELIYNNWEGYLNGNVARHEFARDSFVVKYTISIIHQYLN